jgi:D-beta-D-heptose 7-phosphate kinase/D-beta-D-heptose 1-phosphate adenosyltransferase
MSATSFLESCGNLRILVLGDLILDRYTWGDAERVSPEAPVLVLRVDSKEIRLGGAASVAMLLRGLDAHVSLAGVIGDDPEGRTLVRLLHDEGIDTETFLSVDPSRPTTTKERFVGRAANRHPHQILRVDHETREPIRREIEQWIRERIIARLGKTGTGSERQPEDSQASVSREVPVPLLQRAEPGFDAVLISDYAKGVCTPGLLQAVITAANERQIPVIVDPARLADYSRYRSATLLKPNRLEAELATGQQIRTPEDALAAGQKLHREFQLGSVLVTLDRDGMALVTGEDSGQHFPTDPRTVYDITGAGDMALAALGLCLGARASLPESVMVANAAAGIEVEKFGVAAVTRQEISGVFVRRQRLAMIGRASQTMMPESSKVTILTELLARVPSYRPAGKTIVFTNGCFDLLHVGHIRCLKEAAALGDILIVALNSDSSVRRLKGEGRPVINEHDRAAMVAALGCVDHVVIFDDQTPHRLLEALRPDVLAKGGTTREIVGREVVEAYGGRICRVGEAEGVSTTAIVSRIKSEIPDLRSEMSLPTAN